MKTKEFKIGIIEQDIISLIKYKKAEPKKRKDLVCNQLSFVDDFQWHDFWIKLGIINKELYWELQYLWLDEYYFHTGYHMEKIKRAFKWKELKYIPLRVIYHFVIWLLWEKIVEINYQLYVQLPYQIRNNETNNKTI